MKLVSERKWVVMDVGRKLIAKGNVRDRHLVWVDDTTDQKRVLFYTSASKARAAYRLSGFYTYSDETIREYLESEYGDRWGGRREEWLEPVEVWVTVEVVEGL